MSIGAVPVAATRTAVTLPPGLGQGTPSPFHGLREDEALVWLARLSPFDPRVGRDYRGLPLPGAVATAVTRGWRAYGSVVPVRLSQGGYTAPADDPDAPNQPYPDMLSPAFNFSSALPGTAFGSARGGGGEIRLTRWRDHPRDLTRLAWANREVEILVGRRGESLGEFGSYFRGRLGDASWSAGELRLALLDPKDRLAVPLDLPRFAGTGGFEGPPELTGQTRPATLGVKRGVPGTALDRALHIYQWHFRQVERFIDIRVRGDSVTFDGADYPSYAALADATVASGFYATCDALGLARLGSEPDGEPKADLEGDAGSALGYVDRLDQLVRLVAGHLLPTGAALKDPAGFDGLTLGRVAAGEPGPAGLFVAPAPAPPSGRALLDELTAGAAAWWDIRGDGRLVLILAEYPQAPTRTIPEREISLSAGRVEVEAAPPAVRSVQCGYQQQVAPEREEDLAAGIDDAVKEQVTREWRYPTATIASGTRARHLDAQELVIDGPFDTAASARRAQRRLAPWLGRRPRSHRVPLTRGRFLYQAGQQVRLEDPLTAPGGGNPMWITRFGRDSAGAVELELLGSPEAPPAPALPPVDAGQEVFLAEVDDATINSFDPTYSDARAGTGATPPYPALASTTIVRCGQELFAGNYACWQYALRFDTSSIPAGATVTGATLAIAFQNDTTITADPVLEARAAAWTTPVAGGDFVAGADLGGLTLVAQYDTAGGVTLGSPIDFADVDLATNVNPAGDTVLLLSSSGQRLNQAPTGAEFVVFWSADAIQALAPRLTVTWA